MGDQRGGYDQSEADRYINGDQQHNPDDNVDNGSVEQQGYTYAGDEGTVSARDRIEQQRRSMRRNTGVLVAGRSRNEQRTLYTIVTVISVLVILSVLGWLVLRDNGAKSNNNTNTASNYVAPTPTPSSSGSATSDTSSGLATVAPGIATSGAVSVTTSTDTAPNVDATARPDQPTLPPAAPTNAAGQPTSAPAANTPLPPTNGGSDPSKVRTYAVAAGDTFVSIAAQFGVNTGQLLAANNATLKNTNDLQAGQTINIPAPSYSPPNVQWTVQPNDNLTRIIHALQATDTSPDKIAAANPCQLNTHGVCQPGYNIYPGDTITIPFH